MFDSCLCRWYVHNMHNYKKALKLFWPAKSKLHLSFLKAADYVVYIQENQCSTLTLIAISISGGA